MSRILFGDTDGGAIAKFQNWNNGEIFGMEFEDCKLWLEKKVSNNGVEMTIVVGETEMYPGVFVKKISENNRGKVKYGANDCLNEAAGQRVEPMDVRRTLWPNKSEAECAAKRVSTARHLIKVCQKYDVDLQIYNVERKFWTGANRSGKQIVQVVKLGFAIGLLDRVIEHIPVEKEATRYVCVFRLGNDPIPIG